MGRDYFRFARVPGSIDALDGLRGLAVLLVVAMHGSGPVAGFGGRPAGIDGNPLFWPMLNGWIGVDLFFVLSGYLIASHLFRARERGTFRWRPYLIQRFLRILPTYWFVLAIVVAGLIPGYAFSHAALDLRVAVHLLFLQDYLALEIVGPMWSLAVEEKFYLAAPLIVGAALYLRRTGAQLALLALLVAWPIASRAAAHVTAGDLAWWDYMRTFRFPFHHCLDALAIGMIAALLHRRLPDFCRRHAQLIAWAGIAGVAWFLAGGKLHQTIGWYERIILPTLFALAFGATLLGCAAGGGPQRLLACRPLLVAARISYPLYLIHLTLVPIAWISLGATPADGMGWFLLAWTLYVALSLGAALVIHFAVEKPFLILKDRLSQTASLPLATAGPALEGGSRR